MIKIDTDNADRLCQGDIIRNVELIEYANLDAEGILEISKILYPVIIVLSQDCDLEQDFNNRAKDTSSNEDKHIVSIIVAPLYNVEHVYAGEHLSNLDLRMQRISSKHSKSDNKFLRHNQNPRYHFLEFPDSIPVVNSVIDFKHFFTVNNEYLMERKAVDFVGKLSILYREQVTLRFANYLSRIGLPDTEPNNVHHVHTP